MVSTTAQTPHSRGIDLGVGHPNPNLLPLELVRRAAEHRFAAGDRLILQYGTEQGDPAFRDQLTSFLSAEQLPIRAGQERLAVSGGVSQTLDLLCTLLTSPGDGVVVEEPTYFLSLKLFSDHALRPISVPVDESGMRIDALEQLLEEHRPRLIYTIPFHQNPAGATLSPERRVRLLELARRFDVTVVSDEVYGLLTYDDQLPPVPLAEESDRAISLGSFSKILAPGLRLGWLLGAPPLIKRVCESGMLDSGGGFNPVGGSVVRSALELGLLGGHVRRLRRAYGERRDVLRSALAPLESQGWQISRPAGGYFLWLTGPEQLDSEALLADTVAAGVRYVPGTRFSARGKLRNALRVSFSYCEPEELRSGGELLKEVLKKHSS